MGSEKVNLASTAGRAILVVSTAVSYILCQVIRARLNNPATSPFNTSIANESAKRATGVTPAGATFAIWGLIYGWNGLAVVYCCSLLFRKSDGKPLYMACQFISSIWCLTYSLNLLSNPFWNYLYIAREEYSAEFTLIFAFVIMLVATATSVYQLDLQGSDMTKRGLKVDIWLTRILVLNGTALYFGWTSVAATVSGMSVLVNDVGLPMDVSCYIGLVILLTLFIIWFSLETFAFDRQLRYVFGQYIAFVAALVGIYTKNYDPSLPYEVFAVVLLVVVVVMALAKVIIMIVRGLLDHIVYSPADEDKQQLLGEKMHIYKI